MLESDPTQRFLRGAAEYGYTSVQAERALAEARAERDQPGTWVTTVYEAAIWRLAAGDRPPQDSADAELDSALDADGEDTEFAEELAERADLADLAEAAGLVIPSGPGSDLQAREAIQFPTGDQIAEALEDFDPERDFGDFRERMDPLIHAFTRANPGLHTVQAIGQAVRVDILETPLLFAALEQLVVTGALLLGNHPDGPLYGAIPRDQRRR